MRPNLLAFCGMALSFIILSVSLAKIIFDGIAGKCLNILPTDQITPQAKNKNPNAEEGPFNWFQSGWLGKDVAYQQSSCLFKNGKNSLLNRYRNSLK